MPFLILKSETPKGLADLTASTVLDAVPHSLTIAKRHLPCSFRLRFQLPTSLFELRRDKTTQQGGNLDKRSI